MTGIDGKCCRKSGKWYHPKFSVMDGEGFIPLSHVCVCVFLSRRMFYLTEE